jgi:hypothetical protein
LAFQLVPLLSRGGQPEGSALTLHPGDRLLARHRWVLADLFDALSV